MLFAAVLTRSFGTTKYMVWRHEVGTRKAVAHKVTPENMGDFVVGESARRWDGVLSGVVGSIFGGWSMEFHDE
jgi:hypothetical protein